MVDVCLILESTYPYATGGVSKWTHTLVKNLPHLKFSIVHLYAGAKGERKFEVPENVETIVEIDMRNGLGFRFNFEDSIEVIPDAKIYHSLSTGFAGLLGLQIKGKKNKPLIITEHGLYWKELEFGVDEVECGFKIFRDEKSKNEACVERREFLKIFKEIARRCYLEADSITTVCSYNLEQQLKLVQPDVVEKIKHKFKVIENFVEDKFFECKRDSLDEKVVSFIGRVVSIKDVKTFIKAIPLILEKNNNVKFYVVGDLTQDFEYARECFKLAERLGILERVVFTGEANVIDYLKKTDVLVLPSISEGQPFVILEAMASGVPIVATSTGGIPELVNENGFECGLLFEPGDYVKLVENVVKILTIDNLWRKFSKNGQRKAKRFKVEKFVKEYSELYMRFIKNDKKF